MAKRRDRNRQSAPISGRTRVVAVIGDPVAHSRSPAMHNAAFRALGLDFAYAALRVRSPDLGRAIAGVRALGIAGLNVTVPHKERIVRHLDRLTPRAREIGAVNTVSWQGAALVGDNTDAEGFRRAIDGLGFAMRGKSVLLLGAGGSARAVVWVLVRERVGRLAILNRTPKRARALAGFARKLGAVPVTTGALADALDRDFVAGFDLVVNATSIGLDGRATPPIALESLRRTARVFDLVYAPGSTALVKAARARGCRAADGREMLVQQAALAFRSWTGRSAPVDVMAAAFES